jgi:hypothetical protein
MRLRAKSRRIASIDPHPIFDTQEIALAWIPYLDTTTALAVRSTCKQGRALVDDVRGPTEIRRAIRVAALRDALPGVFKWRTEMTMYRPTKDVEGHKAYVREEYHAHARDHDLGGILQSFITWSIVGTRTTPYAFNPLVTNDAYFSSIDEAFLPRLEEEARNVYNTARTFEGHVFSWSGLPFFAEHERAFDRMMRVLAEPDVYVALWSSDATWSPQFSQQTISDPLRLHRLARHTDVVHRGDDIRIPGRLVIDSFSPSLGYCTLDMLAPNPTTGGDGPRRSARLIQSF